MLEAVNAWLESEGAQVVSLGRGSGSFASAGDGPSMAGLAPRQGLTLDRLRQALAAIDLGDRDTWVKVGMAVHHETEGSEEGFDAWHDRSLECAGYGGERDCRTVWTSFGERDRPPITAKFLLAREREALSPKAQPKPLPVAVPQLPAPTESAEPAKPKPLRFVKVAPDYLAEHQREVEWLIRGVLPRKSLAVAYGPSGAGKTFVVLDMLLRLAAGESWRGLKVNQGQVVWFASEGQGGVGARLAAWSDYHGISLRGLPLFTVLQAPNLLLADWQDIVRTVGDDTALVVFDTLLASAAGANENASEDMGAILGSARQIIEATGASVLLIHHSGKDASKGARGHSSLRAAVDIEMEVTREMGAPEGTITLTKARDAADGLRWHYELATVDLGDDREGLPISSRVAVECDGTPPAGAQAPERLAPHAKWQKAVWAAALTLGDEDGKTEWSEILALADQGMHPRMAGSKDKTRSTTPQHCKRAAESLEARGLVKLYFKGNGSIEYLVVKNSELCI
jgi:hypothetical protein